MTVFKKICEYLATLVRIYRIVTVITISEIEATDDRPAMAKKEIRLVQSKIHIEDPYICVEAVYL